MIFLAFKLIKKPCIDVSLVQTEQKYPPNPSTTAEIQNVIFIC